MLIFFSFLVLSLSTYGYDVKEDSLPEPPTTLLPEKVPGIQLEEVRTRDDVRLYLHPVDFFKLYFTLDIVSHICQYTNAYALEHGPEKPSMFKGWYDFTPDEFYRFCGLIMYAGLVKAPSIDRFWCTKSLYNGLWARAYMSRDRFKSIMCFLKV